MQFEEWFSDHLRWLMRLATVLAGPDQAEDVVQDVAIKAQRSWDRIQAMDHPQAYVRRMVVNEHLSFRRRWGRIVPRDSLDDHHRDAPHRDHRPDLAEQHADRAVLGAEIRELPPRQRAVVVLRYLEDLDDAAIAELLGCRPSTVRSHATRALAALRVQLGTTQRTSQEDSHAH